MRSDEVMKGKEDRSMKRQKVMKRWENGRRGVKKVRRQEGEVADRVRSARKGEKKRTYYRVDNKKIQESTVSHTILIVVYIPPSANTAAGVTRHQTPSL